MMKKKFISIKNLVITLLIIALVIVFSEAILYFNDRKSEAYNAAYEENKNLTVLQIETYPINKLFMASTSVFNWKQAKKANRYKADFTAELKKGYPLMDNLTKETMLDDALNIVVIGDSFVWGSSTLNKNELFWRLIENDLRGEGVRVNVIAVTTPGANAFEEVTWLTDYSLVEDLNPDLVIFGYVYNDPDDSVEISPVTVDWSENLPILSKIGRFLPNIFNRLTSKIATRTMYTDKYSDNNFLPLDGTPIVLKGSVYEKYKSDFVEKLDDFAATVDFPIAVVTLPTLPNNDMLKALYRPLEDLYSDCENIVYYNSIEEYNDFASPKHRKNYSVNMADFHPGSATNRFFANYIESFIKKDFPELIEEYKDGYTATNSIIINDYLPYKLAPVKISEDENFTTYTIEYPLLSETHTVYGVEVASYCLIQPLGKEHIKLSFSNEISIDEVTVEGAYDDIQLYYTRNNEKLNYDDHSIFEFNAEEENVFSVKSKEKITSVLISAEFSEQQNRQIKLTFKKSR